MTTGEAAPSSESPAAPARASSSSPAGDPAPLRAVLTVTFLGSISNGAFWAGLFFVTATHYRFSPARNLALAALMGAVYAIAARGSGMVSRALAGRLSSRAILAGLLGIWGVAALAPTVFPDAEPVLWVGAVVGALTSAIFWPIVESYLAGGRHGSALRGAIGRFNVTWTPATAVPLLAMPLLARLGPLWTLGSCAVVNAVALIGLSGLPSRPASHASDRAGVAVGREYHSLARATSWLLPLSYVISSALSPLLPHRLAAVGIPGASGGAVAALWMASRFVTLLAMWRTGFWHGRWGTLAAAGVALAGGLALVLLAPGPAALIAGLLLYGAGMGLTYYAALYYSMAVGHSAVDAGGSFEALVGVGFCVGPLLGLAGRGASSPAHANSTTLTLIWIATGVASVGVLRAYLRARRARARNRVTASARSR